MDPNIDASRNVAPVESARDEAANKLSPAPATSKGFELRADIAPVIGFLPSCWLS